MAGLAQGPSVEGPTGSVVLVQAPAGYSLMGHLFTAAELQTRPQDCQIDYRHLSMQQNCTCNLACFFHSYCRYQWNKRRQNTEEPNKGITERTLQSNHTPVTGKMLNEYYTTCCI